MNLILDPGQLAAFAAASVVLVGMPGPNIVYITTRALAHGTRAGVVSVLGVETGTAVYVAATTLGLSALVAASPLAFNAIRYAGVAYLVYLAVRELTSRRHGSTAGGPSDRPAPRLARVYLDGLLVNLLNPKCALFFLAFLPQFVSAGAHGAAARAEMLALGVVTVVVALLIDLGYAAAAGAVRRLAPVRTTRTGRGRWRGLHVAGVYLAIAGAAGLGGASA